MARGAKKTNGYAVNGANLGFEERLWQMADKLRGNMDASEYKHIVLGLIFLKYISDSFVQRHDQLELFAAASSRRAWPSSPNRGKKAPNSFSRTG